MSKQISIRFFSLLTAIIILVTSACNQPANNTETPAIEQIATEPAMTETPDVTETPAAEEVTDPNVLYHDAFTSPATGWAEEKFDNYFIGYHEPEYYHVAINSPNYKTTVFIPNKPIFENFDVEVNAFTFAGKTAETGDFRYGIAFRRSGDNYYAFTISQRTKSWWVLKSSGSGLAVLKEGTNDSISDFDKGDILKVDAQGSAFAFFINGSLVGQVDDEEYANGEIGFFVQSLDAESLHIHFDEITVRKPAGSDQSLASQAGGLTLYEDAFTNPATKWPEQKFDNYFVGYHEPEYYHIAFSSPNYRTAVFIPDKPTFDDFTVEVNAFTFAGKTAETGDFRYGVAFRRSGDNYYAFTVSQRTKSWAVLKSTPNELLVLKEGTSDKINDFDAGDILRVDAKGPNFLFTINNEFVAQAEDADYANGEIGFFVQSLDAASLHIHYDSIRVSTFDPQLFCTVKALMNVRSGPGTSFPSDSHLSPDEVIQPTGISKDGAWLNITAAEGQLKGWVANVPQYINCNSTLDVLPVTNP